MGFEGKWCIHPGQTETVNRVFSPSPAEIETAQAVLAAYDASVREGRGAASHNGKMIDAANLRMCSQTLWRARSAGLVQ